MLPTSVPIRPSLRVYTRESPRTIRRQNHGAAERLLTHKPLRKPLPTLVGGANYKGINPCCNPEIQGFVKKFSTVV